MQRPTPREGIRPRYSGLRVQGTAGSPSSTAEDMLAQEGGCVKAEACAGRPEYVYL